MGRHAAQAGDPEGPRRRGGVSRRGLRTSREAGPLRFAAGIVSSPGPARDWGSRTSKPTGSGCRRGPRTDERPAAMGAIRPGVRVVVPVVALGNRGLPQFRAIDGLPCAACRVAAHRQTALNEPRAGTRFGRASHDPCGKRLGPGSALARIASGVASRLLISRLRVDPCRKSVDRLASAILPVCRAGTTSVGAVAQLGERLDGIEEVVGSSPSSSTSSVAISAVALQLEAAGPRLRFGSRIRVAKPGRLD